MDLSDRSQSETVGVILLTAVIVVVTTTAGLLILSDTDEQRENSVLADIEITPTASGVEISHQGGEPLNPTQVRVLVERESGSDQDFTLAEAFAPVNGDSGQFAAGERWEQTTTGTYEGEISVTVVATDRSEVLERTTAVV